MDCDCPTEAVDWGFCGTEDNWMVVAGEAAWAWAHPIVRKMSAGTRAATIAALAQFGLKFVKVNMLAVIGRTPELPEAH